MKIVISEDQYRRLIVEENSCDIFSNKTNVPDYDDILNKKTPRELKNSEGDIIYMSPKEYLMSVARIQGTSYEQQLSYIERGKVTRLENMLRDGDLFDIPIIDYNRKWQEGRHRSFVAQKLGCEKIPVLVVNGSKESFTSGEMEDEGTFRVEDGEFGDLDKDERGYYVGINIRDSKGWRILMRLLNDESGGDLSSLLYSKILSKEFRGYDSLTLKQRSIERIYDYPYDLRVTRVPEELVQLLRVEVSNNIDRETLEEYGVDLDDVSDLFNIIHDRKGDGNLKRIYQYLVDMYSSIIEYIKDENNYDFDESLKDGYSIGYSFDKNNTTGDSPFIIKIYIDKTFSGTPEIYETALSVIFDKDNDIMGDFDIMSIERVDLKYNKSDAYLDGNMVRSYMEKYPFK
jgi:hypothetical protein